MGIMELRNWGRTEVRQLHHIVAENGLSAYVKFRLRRLVGSQTPMALTLRRTKLLVRPASPDVIVALESMGSEFHPVSMLFDRDREGLIIDAGGYIGTAALAMARLYPKATIVSVEASRENHALLEKNVAGQANIHVLKRALVAKGGPETLSLGNRGTGQWGFTVMPGADPTGDTVRTITFDEILKDFGFDRILLVKMDIEGAEDGLLKDDTDWLEKSGALFIELHERIVPGVNDAFRSANQARCVVRSSGEKYLSLSRDVLPECA